MTRNTIIFLVFLFAPTPVWAEDVVYQIKAAYIYNFLQFITFDKVKNGGDPHVDVCVLDKKDQFIRALMHISGQDTPQGKINVIQLDENKGDRVASCNVLYLAGADKRFIREVLSEVDTSQIVTIGESQTFIPNGGFIELFIEDDSVRFRINKNLAGQTRFKVSSQLLSLGVKS